MRWRTTATISEEGFIAELRHSGTAGQRGRWCSLLSSVARVTVSETARRALAGRSVATCRGVDLTVPGQKRCSLKMKVLVLVVVMEKWSALNSAQDCAVCASTTVASE